jgi:ribosomal-protein-alanine N-acetyltransferase
MHIQPIDFINDKDCLASLHAQCFPKSWSAKTFADFAKTAQGLLLSMPSPESEHSLIIDIGFIIYSIAADQADLITLGIIPQSQQQGAGRFLLAHAFEHLYSIGVKELFLEVATDNAAALALYKRTGFVQVGTRPQYYPQETGGFTDAVVLVKELS